MQTNALWQGNAWHLLLNQIAVINLRLDQSCAVARPLSSVDVKTSQYLIFSIIIEINIFVFAQDVSGIKRAIHPLIRLIDFYSYSDSARIELLQISN